MPVGTPIPGCSYSVEEGCLVVRGPILCSGVWSEQAPMTVFRTGDCCEECDGVVVVTGRAAESGVVKVNGVRCSREVIQHLFETCPLVQQAWACALNDGLGVVCRVVEGGTEAAVREWMRRKQPSFRVAYSLRCSQEGWMFAEKASQKRVASLFRERDSLKEVRVSLEKEAVVSSVEDLVALFSRVLARTASEDSDFFLLGGDSLKAIVLLEALHQSGFASLALADVYRNPTPLLLWRFIRGGCGEVCVGVDSRPLVNSVVEDSPVNNSPPPFNNSRVKNSPLNTSHAWRELATIPFRRCVDCNCVPVDTHSFCCCCHGGLLKRVTIHADAVTEDFCLPLDLRVEKSLAVYANKTLVVGGYDGQVLFVDLRTQRVQRHKVAGEIRGRMGVAGRTGVVCTYSGRVYFFDVEAQRLLGSLFIGANCHAAPLVVEGEDGAVRAVCCSINSAVLLVEWRQQRLRVARHWSVGEPVFAEPVGVGKEVLVVTVKGRVLRLSLVDYEVREWALEVGGLVYAKPVRVGAREWVFTTTEGEVVRADVESGSVKERVACGGSLLMSPVRVSEDEMIMCAASGEVYSVVRGQARRVYVCSGAVFSDPVVVEGCVVFGCRDDRVVVLCGWDVCWEID